MTLTELRYIVALAQEGHFSRAAESCAVSQPTLSVAIARLESELGVQLFERGIGFVSPSSTGLLIVEQARRVLGEADKVRQLAHDGRDPLNGALRLGIIHTVAPYLLPSMIQSLARLAPQMPLLIEENMTTHLCAMLRDNDIDVAILALPYEAPGILTRPLYDEAFEVIVPASHPWAGRECIEASEIRENELLLLKAGNCFRDQVLDACPQVSTPESDLRMGHSLETIRSMVASGLGISVLPKGATRPPYFSGLIRAIPFCAPQPFRRVGLAWRVGFVRPKAIDALTEATRDYARDVSA